MVVAIVMMVNYNCGADLSRETHDRHEERATSHKSMVAPFQLGKSLFPQESRLIEFPLGSYHSFCGFFISAVSTTIDSCLHRQTWKKDRFPVAPRSSLAALVKRLHN